MYNANVRINICLFLYDHGGKLADIMECILVQTDDDFEFNISDNNSTDSSWDIIQKYVDNHNKIKVIKTLNIFISMKLRMKIYSINSIKTALLEHFYSLS